MLRRLFHKRSIYNTCSRIRTSTVLQQTDGYSTIQQQNIVRSVAPPLDIPKIFIEEYIWRKLEKWENKTALECAETGRTYLHSEVYNKSRALSNFLRYKMSLKEKDTVAVIIPNIPEFAIVILGIIQAGLTCTTVNCHYKSAEISKQLLHSEAKVVFTVNNLWSEVSKAILQLKIGIPQVIVKHKQEESLPRGTIDFGEMIEGNFEISYQSNRSIDDTIILPYSSGTTGLPKGVELTHKNIVANLCQMTNHPFNIIRDSEGSFQEVQPALLPLFHIYGLVSVLLQSLCTGGKLITIPKFHPETFIHFLETNNPTFAYLVPPTVLFLLNEKIRPQLIYQMENISSGGAPLASEDINRLREKVHDKTTFLQMFGQTETSPLTHSQTTLVKNGVKVGGAGFTVANTESLITAVNTEDVTSLDTKCAGELCVRGPQVMKGYFKNPEATKDAIDSNGWYKTGDLAFFDEDGHIFITERLKELIKVKGFQVAPAELEAILRNHPSIEEAAVVGVPHPIHGEAPRAFITCKADAKINTSDIKEYVASKVAHFKQLTGGVVVIDSIPKSASGKILRRQLKNIAI